MKQKNNQKTARATGVAIALGITIAASGSANAEVLTGLVYGGNNIFTFDSGNTTTILSSVGVTGLSGGDILVGIDYLGTTLYGVGQGGNLYTISSGGAASLVSHFTGGGGLSGINYGVNADNGRIQIISDASIDIVLNASTGAVISSGSTSQALTALSSGGSGLYAVDSVGNTLGTLSGSGVYSAIGGMGYDVSGKNGFDISAFTGIAYFASAVSSSGTAPNLYTVNLSDGSTTLVGAIGTGEFLVGGLTAVPEPTTTALAVLGGAGMLAMLRRRK